MSLRNRNRPFVRTGIWGLAVVVLAGAAFGFYLRPAPTDCGRVLTDGQMAAVFGDAPTMAGFWCNKSIQCNQGFVTPNGSGGQVCYRCGSDATPTRKVCCQGDLNHDGCNSSASTTPACKDTNYFQASDAPAGCPANCSGYADSGNPCGVFDVVGGGTACAS